MPLPSDAFVLTVLCPDTVGIVAAIAGYLHDSGYCVEESSQFSTADTSRFFMRTVFSSQSASHDEAAFAQGFSEIAGRFSMDWQLHDTNVRPRVLIMVSRLDHCLNDLLYRYRTGALAMDIPAIVSNHAEMGELAEWHEVPFFHIPVTPDNRTQAETQLLEIAGEADVDAVVLARYMQILSDETCNKLAGRVINIHHSFLPGFKGARPYAQAFERGVKLIGATAHYVTRDLDEGPIIEQAVERVDHVHGPEDLEAVGRDVECLTLARALKFHLEHRVFIDGAKTVVLR